MFQVRTDAEIATTATNKIFVRFQWINVQQKVIIVRPSFAHVTNTRLNKCENNAGENRLLMKAKQRQKVNKRISKDLEVSKFRRPSYKMLCVLLTTRPEADMGWPIYVAI